MIKNNVIIILVWNDYLLTKDTIDSVLQCADDNFDILIVDNASTTDCIGQLKEHYCNNECISYLLNDKNWGYAEGNNIALNYCYEKGYKYFYVLNNDLFFEKSSILTDIANYLKKDPNIGIIAPLIWNKQDDGSFKKGTLETNSRLYNKMLLDSGVHLGKLSDGLWQVATVSGCFIVLTRKCLEKCLGFEKQFFMYAEEDDLCIRATLAGLKVVRIERDYGVKHLGGALNFYAIKDWKRIIGNRNKILLTRNFSILLRIKYLLILFCMTLSKSIKLFLKKEVRSGIVFFLSYFEGLYSLAFFEKQKSADILFKRGQSLPSKKRIYRVNVK